MISTVEIACWANSPMSPISEDWKHKMDYDYYYIKRTELKDMKYEI